MVPWTFRTLRLLAHAASIRGILETLTELSPKQTPVPRKLPKGSLGVCVGGDQNLYSYLVVSLSLPKIPF